MPRFTQGLLFSILALALFSSPSQAQVGAPGTSSFLAARYEIVMKDCRAQLERTDYDGCLNGLRTIALQVSVPTTELETEIKAAVGYYTAFVQAVKDAGTMEPSRPDTYFNPIFKVLAGTPEKYFPYEEAVGIWNRYLREDVGQARFKRYRRLKLIVRSGEEDPQLQEDFFRALQPQVLEFGFSILDPETSLSTNPDILLKLGLKGAIGQDSMDPRYINKKVYRLAIEFQSMRFVTAQERVEVPPLELEIPATPDDTGKEEAIKQGSTKVTRLLFYHTLRKLYPVMLPMP